MFRRSYKAPYVRVVLKARAWRRVPMKLLKWGRKMPSTKQYNLVPNDEYDTRIPLHPDEAFAYGITFQAKMTVTTYGISYIIHLDYNRWTMSCDIALILVQNPFPLEYNLKRVIIQPWFPANAHGIVAGWGVINEETKATAVVLRVVDQIVKSESFCMKDYGRLDGTMCAKSSQKHNAPAMGDSGSALIIDGIQQIGLVSFRSSAARDTIFYSNLSYFYDWIHVKTVNLYCM